MDQERKSFKRKKKSFFQQSIKFHKRGIHGKGVRIDDESYEYFLNVLKIMNQEFETVDDKKVFVENVFKQLEEHEVTFSSNQVVSRVIDNLLPFVSESTLSRFMQTFLESLRPLCMDQFASFVLEKLIITVTNRFLESFHKENYDSDNIVEDEKFNWLSTVSRYVLNNLEEFVFSNYPNRIMRTVICCLVGCTSPINKDDTVIVPNSHTPEALHKIMKDFAKQLLQWPRFNELAYNTLSSSFLQVLLQCLISLYPKLVKKLGRKILDEYLALEPSQVVDEDLDHPKMSSAFDNVSATRLLEVVISVASSKLFTRIYSDFFCGRLSQLACHPTANFSVQKLLRFSSAKEEFEAMFDELSSCFENILTQGKKGVILELCAGCVRLKTKQSAFMLAWMKYLGCEVDQSLLAILTIYMKRKNEYDNEEVYNIELHGSLLLQNMLKFNKPIKVISSLLDMKTETLCHVLCNPKGSYIANAVFESQFIGEKSKDKFMKVLQNHYSALAVSKHGSRVFDIIWQWANVKNKSLIASELLNDEATLSNSPYGRPIISKASLGCYRRSKEEWMKAQNRNNKVEKLFADII